MSSAIPATDALGKILQDDSAVLLKMNPVNEYLGPVFEQALRPLMTQLSIIYGGSDVGSYAVHHPQIDRIHLTGCNETHDAIVWGRTFISGMCEKRMGHQSYEASHQ